MPFASRGLHPLCRMIVVIPAKDEEARIGACLDALLAQRTVTGAALDPRLFEIRVLVNNSSDHTLRVIQARQERYPQARLHVQNSVFPADQANVGYVRRHLFTTAARDWAQHGQPGSIATTDADSWVGPAWVAGNLAGLSEYDLIAGNVLMHRPEFARASAVQRKRIAADRAWRTRLARYAAYLDPNDSDPWPHHYHHTGASLAIRSSTYAAIGGMPAVAACEDVALVRAAFARNARIRHDPRVVVYTSARLQGRAHIGMSATLREWEAGGGTLFVPQAQVLGARLELRAAIRRVCTIDMHDKGNAPQAAGLLLSALRQARQTGFPADALHELLRSGQHFGAIWSLCRAWFETAHPGHSETPHGAIDAEISRLDTLIRLEREDLQALSTRGTSRAAKPDSARRNDRPNNLFRQDTARRIRAVKQPHGEERRA